MNMHAITAALGFITTLLFVAVARPQGPSDPGALVGQVIQGCEIDVRPLVRPEAQLYYQELPSQTVPLPANHYAIEFQIHVTMGDALEVSTWDAREPAVRLQTGGANTVRLLIDATGANPVAKIIVTWPNGTVKLDKVTRYSGTFDPLGLFQDPPSIETVKHDSPLKGRIRLTGRTRGVGIAFTLSDV